MPQPLSSIEWSTDHVLPKDRGDAMEAALERSFRRWNLSFPPEPAFQARLRLREFAGASIVHIATDPCAGQLPVGSSQFNDELYLGLQLNVSGQEQVQMLHWDEQIRAGDMFLWRTDLRQRFEVQERIQSVSLMVPWQLMREHLPGHKQPPPICRIDSHSGVGSLLARHLLALAKEIDTVPPVAHATLCRTAIELLGVAIPGPQGGEKFNAMAALRERTLAYIALHLHEDDLSPARIAAAHGISLRYLHVLFAQGDTTVARHILESRLQACRQALIDPASRHLQISEIAFRWGFNSTSHFNRAFKQRYGASPGEMRSMAAH
ncbi:helix-turn-helix domain-containing protein [Burkholderia vietnamiensis]|uniref:Helix-turn-helix domain-containing protein n=1 Tax=Burkholderia vietnamiensis TaxID=60552 RepID=A0AAW7SZ75_BURVI|nr:helix-turn-helix domain-containing protein [Burkholderia vietnamiensis]MDN7795088.1 helix-turn-helix domain-containing protein [Burkholderia vietnamiensis]